MPYEVFKTKILDYARVMGLSVRFNHTNGRHYANFSNGLVIVGNAVALSLCARWGSGHTATFQL